MELICDRINLVLKFSALICTDNFCFCELMGENQFTPSNNDSVMKKLFMRLYQGVHASSVRGDFGA